MTRLLLGLFLALQLGAAQAQTRWTMPTEYPASAIPGEGVALFAKLVAEKSKGMLVIEPSFDAKKGIKSAGMIAAVEAGTVEAGDAFSGALGGADPVFALSSLPFVVSSIDEARKLATLARPLYENQLAAHGQKLLYTTPWPASGIWSKTALASAADVRRLSIRTYDATSTDVFNGFGAKATNLSFADAMPRIQEGAVDAVLSSGDGGAGRNLWQYLPHFLEVNYALPLSLATVNKAAYDALPPEARQAVDEAAAATEERQWSVIRTRLDENYARMRANGVTIRTEIATDIHDGLVEAAKTAVGAWRTKAGGEAGGILDRFKQK